MLSVQVFGAGGNNRNTAPEYFGLMGVALAAAKASERKRPCRSRATARRSSFIGRSIGGIVMNTAVARRLALGDRVVWIGKDDYQPSGPGTITRITAHQVEVLWEDETARRYRRTQLHNLRHKKLVCELHGARGA
jgi:hypothetical protein